MITIVDQPYQPLETVLPDNPPYVLLKTGLVTNRERWSILGWDPWLTWMPQDHRDPLSELEAILKTTKKQLRATSHDVKSRGDHVALREQRLEFPLPLLMGALSYDLGRQIEEIPAIAADDLSLPQAVLYGFRQFVIADEAAKRCWRIKIDRKADNEDLPTRVSSHEPRTTNHESNFTKAEYLETVSRIREMIAAGDCYQVNLSQRCHGSTKKSAQRIFQEALQSNPASMMALIDTGEWQIISTSPERLVKRAGNRLISEPIKGTAPRNDDAVVDASIREELLTSEKNRAELAMIVDLMRNDLGRVAEPGSVEVTDPCRLESYTNVYHLVATVSAKIKASTSWGEIFRAIFPGGSITGCPKVQAMRVIEQCEKVRRHFYCGSIGYIDLHGDGDWNIAIRTLTKLGDRALFHLGGGIVYDSDPVSEYEETLQKGETIFGILK